MVSVRSRGVGLRVWGLRLDEERYRASERNHQQLSASDTFLCLPMINSLENLFWTDLTVSVGSCGSWVKGLESKVL